MDVEEDRDATTVALSIARSLYLDQKGSSAAAIKEGRISPSRGSLRSMPTIGSDRKRHTLCHEIPGWDPRLRRRRFTGFISVGVASGSCNDGDHGDASASASVLLIESGRASSSRIVKRWFVRQKRAG